MLSFLYSSTLTSIHVYWKNHTFDYMDLCLQVMSLLFNTLSRFVITFLPRSECLLISCLHSPSALILEPNNINNVSIVSPSTWNEMMGLDAMILLFWVLSQVLSFKSGFWLSSFTFKMLFSSSAFCHKGDIIFISEFIISPRNLDSFLCFIQPGILLMYFAYKLSKQGDNIQP